MSKPPPKCKQEIKIKTNPTNHCNWRHANFTKEIQRLLEECRSCVRKTTLNSKWKLQELIRRWDGERELLRSAPGSYPNSLK